jgi:hypothetical protein
MTDYEKANRRMVKRHPARPAYGTSEWRRKARKEAHAYRPVIGRIKVELHRAWEAQGFRVGTANTTRPGHDRWMINIVSRKSDIDGCADSSRIYLTIDGRLVYYWMEEFHSPSSSGPKPPKIHYMPFWVWVDKEIAKGVEMTYQVRRTAERLVEVLQQFKS